MAVWNLFQMIGAGIKWLFRKDKTRSFRSMILDEDDNGILGICAVIVIGGMIILSVSL